MRKTIAISILLNILFIGLLIGMIYKRGGIDYIKKRINGKSDKFGFDNDFYRMRKSIFQIMPIDSNAIYFVGTSITGNCDWSELFSNSHIKNRGIGGDLISGVANRIDEILISRPKKIFLEIGINDLEQQRTVPEIIGDYEQLIDHIRKVSPFTELYVESILPTFNNYYRSNSDIAKINNSLIEIAKVNGVVYIDLNSCLKSSKDELDSQYSLDGFHLNGKGYLVLKKELDKYIIN